MKHYKDKKGQYYAYELDGSQDHLIPKNFTKVELEEVQKNSDEATQKILEKMNTLDPVEKLSNFLKDNPDVANLLSGVNK